MKWIKRFLRLFFPHRLVSFTYWLVHFFIIIFMIVTRMCIEMRQCLLSLSPSRKKTHLQTCILLIIFVKLIDSNSWNFPINRFSKDCILMRRQAFTWTTCAFPFSQWNNTGCFYCIPSHWTGSWSNKDLIMKQNATGEQNGLMDGWHGIFFI